MNLLDLPPELVVRIADHLTTPQLAPLRCTCKRIEASLFDSFANEFFTKRQFMVEHWSLEALVGIANHPGLASRLKEVLISNHLVQITDPDFDRQSLLNGHMSRSTLLASGEAYRMLVEVFSKLPNLRIVGLRDFDGLGRDRDGPDAKWRSWGWSTYKGKVMIDSPDSLFAMLTSAMGAAQASPSNLNLEVMFRGRSFLGPDAFPTSKYSTSFASLKTMFLSVSAAVWFCHHMAPQHTYDPNRIVVTAPLQRFLHQTTGLETLRLKFKNDYFSYRFLEWFACSAPANLPPIGNALPVPPLQLDQLRCLDLGMCIVAASTLERILTKYDLESFSLWKVTLYAQDMTVDHWSELLRSLGDKLPATGRLRTVKIGWTTQSHHRMPSEVKFVAENADLTKKMDAKMLSEVFFQARNTGKTPHQWLKELAARTFVPHIHDPSHVSDSDSDDSDEVIDLESDDLDDESEDEDD